MLGRAGPGRGLRAGHLAGLSGPQHCPCQLWPGPWALSTVSSAGRVSWLGFLPLCTWLCLAVPQAVPMMEGASLLVSETHLQPLSPGGLVCITCCSPWGHPLCSRWAELRGGGRSLDELGLVERRIWGWGCPGIMQGAVAFLVGTGALGKVAIQGGDSSWGLSAWWQPAPRPPTKDSLQLTAVPPAHAASQASP